MLQVPVVHRLVRSVLAPTRGKAFFTACLSIAGGLYLAGITDGRPNPASAKSLGGPIIVKPEVIDVPHASAGLRDAAALRPMVAAPIPPDRPTLVRRLQAALARAGCYDGPVSGVWSEPSQSAMGRFIAVANAQLPVSEPDPALLALVESNDGRSCGRSAIITGSIAPPQPVPLVVADNSGRDATPAPVNTAVAKDETATDETPSMIERSWAPAAMLVTPKAPAPEATGPVSAPQPDARDAIIVGSSTPDGDESRQQPATATQSKTSPAKTEVAKAMPDASAPAEAIAKPRSVPPLSEQKVEIQPDPTAPPDPREEPRETKTKKDKAKVDKAKTAKRKAKPGSSPSFSEGFDQLQRSVSNFFN